MLLKMRAASMVAQSSSNSHPDIDLTKVGNSTKQLYFDMMGAIPYFTAGTSTQDVVTQEREAAAEEYNRVFVEPYKKRAGFEEEKLEKPTIL